MIISAPAKSHAHGFVGNSFLDVTTTETDSTHVEGEGSVDMAVLSLHEKMEGDTVEISGDVNTPRDSGSVNVEVAKLSDGNKQYRGWVGEAGVQLQQLHQKDGSEWIIGDVGGRRLSVTYTTDAKGVHFSGTTNNDFVDVHIDAGAPAHPEMIVPLLGLGR